MAKAKKSEEVEPKVAKTSVPRRRKEQTIRQRAEKANTAKPRRIRNTAGRVSGPIRKINPARKLKGKQLTVRGRRIKLIPSFISGAWSEIRQTTWPTWRDTVRLTIAVFIFAVIFAAFVGVLDYGLGKLFKEVIIKQ